MARPALPTGPGTRVFSGARAIFAFNGEIVGFASGVSGSEEIQYEPVDVLDHLETMEHVPVGYRVTFSAQIFRTIARGASDDVNAPGSLKEQKIYPKFDEILRVVGVECVIQDTITKKILHQLVDVKAATNNFSIGARSIVGQNVGFVARKMLDESEVKG